MEKSGPKNIVYKSKELRTFYSCNRSRWDDFYPSERYAFLQITGEHRALGDVLDVGCACGGLGAALSEKFLLRSYTGVDINQEAIDWASREQRLPVAATFVAGDIIELSLRAKYDLVVSLSCADWNLEVRKIIDACWDRVKEGGHLVLSLRLTPEQGVNDISRSFQYINFSGKATAPELANYVVFNLNEALRILGALRPAPAIIGAYGYWGKPSATAVTPYDRLVFAVLYLRKGEAGSSQSTEAELRLPLDIFI